MMSKKILLIEDNPYDARLMMRILEKHGYDVVHAEDATRGLEEAVTQQPDLVLLDMGLPDMDGQTVAALFRQTPDLVNLPLIAVTAWPPDTAREMAEAYGCLGYISKPISARTFPTRIANYLSNLATNEA
jgi:two-component system cell cycle response regulator DivK